MHWLWWTIPLVLLTFFWTVNEHLRGSLTQAVSGVLALMMFGCVIIAFVYSGWMIGLGALVGTFILINILRPAARSVASRILGQ